MLSYLCFVTFFCGDYSDCCCCDSPRSLLWTDACQPPVFVIHACPQTRMHYSLPLFSLPLLFFSPFHVAAHPPLLLSSVAFCRFAFVSPPWPLKGARVRGVVLPTIVKERGDDRPRSGVHASTFYTSFTLLTSRHLVCLLVCLCAYGLCASSVLPPNLCAKNE